MSIIQAIRMALVSILSSKMRSFLTMLGIIIGVISVTILVSIVQGTVTSVTGSISDMGSTLVTCTITADDPPDLTLEDLAELEGEGSVDLVAPMISSTVTTIADDTTYSTTVQGTTTSYLDIEGLAVADGRFFNDVDLEYENYVCVVGTDVAENLFSTRSCVGNYLEMSGKKFLIVGVLEYSGSDSSGSKDDCVIIPFTTAQKLLQVTDITEFYASADSSDTVTTAQATLEKYLYILTADEDSYSVYSETEVLDTISSVTNTMALMLGGIASISLLVGGIGIMNIMLVSVSERTREIGIRKSIGAKRRNILTQFLVEALTLSIIGGLIGLVLGKVGIVIASILMNSEYELSIPVALAAMAFSMVIGIIFGLYPAFKAARLKPIDALRYE